MASKARDLSRRGHRVMSSAMTEDSITKAHVGLGNVANVDLSNVTNESKATMFTSPTFTGTPVLPSGTTLDGAAMQYASCTTSAIQQSGSIDCKRWTKTFNPGASSSTMDVMKLARWWWGTGCLMIHSYEWYYGPDTNYRLDKFVGTTRPGYSPSFSNIFNSGGNGPYCANHNTSAENVDVKLDLSAYRRTFMILEVWGMSYMANSGDVGAGNEYHPYGFLQIN